MPGLEARLAEQRRLLVAGHAADGRPRPAGRRPRRRRSPRTARWRAAPRAGSDGGTCEQVGQLVAPGQAADVVEQGPAGVGRVGGVDRAGRQLPQDPAVDRSERQVGPGARPRLRSAATPAWWPRSRGRGPGRFGRGPAEVAVACQRPRSGPRCGGPATRWPGAGAGRSGGPTPPRSPAGWSCRAPPPAGPGGSAPSVRVAATAAQISLGSCSTQPGRGKYCGNSRYALRRAGRPRRRRRLGRRSCRRRWRRPRPWRRTVVPGPVWRAGGPAGLWAGTGYRR